MATPCENRENRLTVTDGVWLMTLQGHSLHDAPAATSLLIDDR